MRIFLDANVLFSAARSSGAVRELLRRLRMAGHVLCVDAYVVFEARRNLESKAREGERNLDAVLEHCEVIAFSSTVVSEEWAALLPEKDRPVVAAMIRSGCDVLVTGDRRHFGALFGRTIEGVTIHSPRSLAEGLAL